MQGPIDLPPPPPLRPRSVADILEAAFTLYRRHWATLFKLVAVVVVPLTVLQYLIADLVADDAEIRAGRIVLDEGAVAAALGGAAVIGIASLLITQILVGAIAWAVASILVGREPDVSDSYRHGYRRLWSILLVSILSVLAVLAGLILLVIPGLIVLTRLTVAIPAVIVERRRGSDALRRSWDLVKGFGWPVFGALVVTGLLTGIVNSIFTAPAGDNWLVLGIAASLGSVITTPFTALVVGLIYFDLRVRKERLDVPTLQRELDAAAAA